MADPLTQQQYQGKGRQADPDGATLGRLLAVHDERRRQEAKYPGTTCASPDHSDTDRMTMLLAEVGEVSEEVKMLRWPHTRPGRGWAGAGDSEVRERLRTELVQVMAICLAWMEHIDSFDAEVSGEF